MSVKSFDVCRNAETFYSRRSWVEYYQLYFNKDFDKDQLLLVDASLADV